MDINEMADKEKAELRESLRLDAERYRKLKTWLGFMIMQNLPKAADFDSAVDALPDPNENSNRSR